MGRLRILFDHQVFSEQRYGGVSRYFFELMRRLPPLGAEISLSLGFSNNTYLRGTPEGGGALYCGGASFRGKNRLMNMLNLQGSRAALRGGAFDVFHPTYFDPYFLEGLRGKPFVLTVYDMIHEMFPENFSAPREREMAARKRLLAERAARVITISRKTKDDLVRLCGLDPDKVIPIHLANSLNPALASKPAGIPHGPGYFLFVGERSGYKNFPFLCRALAPLFSAGFPLVCAGGGEFSVAERALFSELGVKAVVRVSVGDQELAWLYANAAALVVPSLYEGFGIPLLEAFACGCPALLSDAGSLPEVGGEAALYFSPSDESSLLRGARLLLETPGLRERLVSEGAQRNERFSWDRTAAETMKVYEELA